MGSAMAIVPNQKAPAEVIQTNKFGLIRIHVF